MQYFRVNLKLNIFSHREYAHLLKYVNTIPFRCKRNLGYPKNVFKHNFYLVHFHFKFVLFKWGIIPTIV